MNLRLLQSAQLNTSLTAQTLEPMCTHDPQFKLNLQAMRTREKVQKATARLQDFSLPLRELPTVVEEIQRENWELGWDPEYHNIALINVGLRLYAELQTMERIEHHLAQ